MVEPMVNPPEYQRRPQSDIPDDKARRKCLKCSKMFESAWKGNRLCKHCSLSVNRNTRNVGSIKPELK